LSSTAEPSAVSLLSLLAEMYNVVAISLLR
jgi:hypothetical protein